jgi:hypothetical protein
MKFFNIDCHISVISDIKNIFESLGHKVDHWSLSGHRWVFDFNKCKSPIINEANWTNLDQEMVDQFYDHHKEDLDSYDAFICAYPPCFLKLFEKFNKPIIVIAATRYDHPFTNDQTRLDWLEDSLKNNKNLILTANNQFDQKYCEHFLGNKWEWIPSLCDYTESKYNPKKQQSILFSKFNADLGSNVLHQSSLGNYSWKDLYSYKSIIHMPYNISTMSIFEQYQAGVPLNIPSLNFLLELVEQGYPVLTEITFPTNDPKRNRKNFLKKEWLRYSDFYNGTVKCNYLDKNLKLKYNVTNTSNKDSIFFKWEKILEKIK